MKRKVLSLLLCGVMAGSMLTACGDSDDSAEAEKNAAVEEVSEEDDSSNHKKASATILDSVKYHNDYDDVTSGYSMLAAAKSYLKDKGITYQEEDDDIVSTISDDFLGYRAYYSWDGDDYFIDLTFDSEDELQQAVSDVREYLSGRADPDFEGTDFCQAVEEDSSRWEEILAWYESGEVFCTDYSQDGEEIYIEAVSFDVLGGLSDLRTENEAEYILGDCDSFLEIMVGGGAPRESAEEAPAEDTDEASAEEAEDAASDSAASDTSQSASSDTAGWKQTYADYFRGLDDDQISYYEIYDINHDGIPEILGFDGSGMYPDLFYINASGEVEQMGMGQFPDILDNGKICCCYVIVGGEEIYTVHRYNNATKEFECIFDGRIQSYDFENGVWLTTPIYLIDGKQYDADVWDRWYERAFEGESADDLDTFTSGDAEDLAEAILNW